MNPITKKNLDKEVLQRMYVEQKKSLDDIAKELKVAAITVYRYMERYNIPRRQGGNGKWTDARRKIVSERVSQTMLGNKHNLKQIHYEYAMKSSAIKRAKELRGDKCEICGWAEAACDGHHKVSIINGGKHTVANIMILCPNHHRLEDIKNRDNT